VIVAAFEEGEQLDAHPLQDCRGLGTQFIG
jgi:hypothetical protein